jgi:hypothetical protein
VTKDELVAKWKRNREAAALRQAEANAELARRTPEIVKKDKAQLFGLLVSSRYGKG